MIPQKIQLHFLSEVLQLDVIMCALDGGGIWVGEDNERSGEV